MDAALESRVRRLWAGAAGVPVSAFSPRGLRVTAAVRGTTTPPGWFGAVVVGDRVLVTAPDEDRGEALTRAVAGAGTSDAGGLLTAVVAKRLPGVEEVLGPAWLSYAVPGAASPSEGERVPTTTWELEALDNARCEDLVALVEACSPAEADESAVQDLTHVQVVRDTAGVVVAAAGWEPWPGGVAHVGVLAAPSARGSGAAAAAAGAAVQAALRLGLLVQWRARPPSSRRLARHLGLAEVGWQLSWR